MLSKGFCLQSTVFLLALCANPFSSKPLIHCNIGYNAIANGYPSSDPNVPLPLVRCNFANKKATYDFDCQPDSCTGLILSQECKIDNRNPVEHGFSISRNELQSYKLASDPKYLEIVGQLILPGERLNHKAPLINVTCLRRAVITINCTSCKVYQSPSKNSVPIY